MNKEQAVADTAASQEQARRTPEEIAKAVAAQVKQQAGANVFRREERINLAQGLDEGVRKLLNKYDVSPASKEIAVQAGIALHNPRSPTFLDLGAYQKTLMEKIPEFSENLDLRKGADALIIPYVYEVQELNGLITHDMAVKNTQEALEKLSQVNTWEQYRSYVAETNKDLMAMGVRNFQLSGTSYFGGATIPTSRVVGTSLSISSQLASAALGGQIANASSSAIGAATESPKPGKSEADEGGFLMTGGEAKKAPESTREDAGQLDIRLATVMAETLAEEKERINNTVAEAKARTRHNERG